MFRPIDKSQEFYVLDLYTNNFTKIGNEDALKEWLIYHPGILSDLNMTGNDVKRYYTPEYKGDFVNYKQETYLRRYMFFDGLYRIIDIRHYMPDTSNSFGTCWRWVRTWYKGLRFRKDPVPHTGKYGGYGFYRSIRTQQERRLNADPEHKKYVRPSRRTNNLPTSWDEIPRNMSRCWKDQSKKKRQWM